MVVVAVVCGDMMCPPTLLQLFQGVCSNKTLSSPLVSVAVDGGGGGGGGGVW